MSTKRVGKPKGVTDKDVIVAQKRAEKEADNPLKQVYREGIKVDMEGQTFRKLLNAALYIQQQNIVNNYVQDPKTGEQQIVSYSYKIEPEAILELVQSLLVLHLDNIEKGNTVSVDVLREEALKAKAEA